jgi:parallel beta-helix repeat protein
VKASRRSWRRLLGIAAVFVTISLIGASQASASPALIVTSNTTLSADYNGDIVVVGSGVTLDCVGHRVTGAVVGVGVGINVVANGVTVTRCQVQGFDVGILTSADSTHILANVLRGDNQGIRLAGATNATVSRNVATENRDWGIIAAQGASGATISGNVANKNGLIGIALNTVANNVVRGNTANQNGATGIDSLASARNQIVNNVAVNNGNLGFGLQGSDSNTFVGNVANNNGTPGNGSGFSVNNSSGSSFSRNVALNNGGVGFFVFFLSQSNTFTLNVGCGNFFVDAADISTGSGNTWSNNAFCKTEGI